MIHLTVRSAAGLALAALGFSIGSGASPALAQQGTPAGTPGASSPGAWSTYPGVTNWGGYAPGASWGGYYVPPTAPPAGTAWRGYAPGAAWSGYAPASGAVAGGYPQPATTAPAVRYVPGVRAASAPSRRSSPAAYREFGTGRNVFMHKPWLPNQ